MVSQRHRYKWIFNAVVFSVVLCMTGCQNDRHQAPVSCTLVYLDMTGATELEYEIYLPVYQVYTYIETRVIYNTDTARYTYWIDR
ncbi:MAG: hypothetical protein R3330_01550, partial [Saprospiraceae bacterium]|nr:hypothetical protein [Saprospiraceae bacterium]